MRFSLQRRPATKRANMKEWKNEQKVKNKNKQNCRAAVPTIEWRIWFMSHINVETIQFVPVTVVFHWNWTLNAEIGGFLVVYMYVQYTFYSYLQVFSRPGRHHYDSPNKFSDGRPKGLNHRTMVYSIIWFTSMSLHFKINKRVY